VITPAFEIAYHQFAVRLLAEFEAGVLAAVGLCNLCCIGPGVFKRRSEDALLHRQITYQRIDNSSNSSALGLG